MHPKQLRILVIEEEAGNKAFFEHNLLTKMGLLESNITFRDNHVIAREDFPEPEKAFDIILSDIHPGSGNGIDYVRWLRQDAQTRGVNPPAFVLHTTDTRTAEKYLKGHPNCEEDLIDGLATKEALFNPSSTIRTLQSGLDNAQARHTNPAATINASTAATFAGASRTEPPSMSAAF